MPRRKNVMARICSSCGDKQAMTALGCYAVWFCSCGGNRYISRDGRKIRPMKNAPCCSRIKFRKVMDLDDADRLDGVWMPAIAQKKLSIYVACPGCGAVNNLTDAIIARCGRCECFHCSQCDLDVECCLEDWSRYKKYVRSTPVQVDLHKMRLMVVKGAVVRRYSRWRH